MRESERFVAVKGKQVIEFMSANSNLHKAKDAKNDEFYTQLTDVAKELMHYKAHFKDKIVFCNCDDPTWSAFWKYFHLNFAELGLKKLISTHYDREEATYKMEYTGGDDNNIEVGVRTPLEGNGDFRNKECLDLLDECDIVVTNPPFSLFREYVAVLMEHEKKFLILGNMNALTYKEIFPLIRDNQLWYGASIHSGDRKFYVPDDYPLKASGCGIDEDGRRFIRVKGVRWYTNLDYQARYEKLVLWKKYTPEEYPKYDNYDAINVDKVSEIPCDYDGVMGVPITFMDKYNPKQFEILGCTANPESNSVKKTPRSQKAMLLIKQGRLKGAKCVGGNSNIFIDKDDYVHVLYHRLLIRKKVGV